MQGEKLAVPLESRSSATQIARYVTETHGIERGAIRAHHIARFTSDLKRIMAEDWDFNLQRVLGAVPTRRPMFISHQHRLIFYEVPRTGSRSITVVLTRLDPNSPTVSERKQRGDGSDFHFMTGEEQTFFEYRLIAAHRNPYDRLWSFWKYRRQHGNPDTFRSISWARYIDWVCEPESVPEIAGALVDAPITEMLDASTVDDWLDFHKLDKDWLTLSRELGLPTIPLSKLNDSLDHGAMHRAYKAPMAARVAERFAADFEYFGYSVDSWKAGRALGCCP